MDNVEMIDKKQAIKRIKEYTADVFEVDLNDSKQFAGDSRQAYICEGLYEATELLDDLQPVDVAPIMHGEWEIKIIPPTCGSDTIKAVGKCTKCGCDDSVQHKDAVGYYKGTPIIWSGFITNFYEKERMAEYFAYSNANKAKKRKYCPNCGARMAEEVKM